MSLATVADLLQALRTFRLLEPPQLEKLAKLQYRLKNPRTVAQKLQEGRWLTAYQVQQLLDQGMQAGLLLGSYVILDKLGEGGMGQVFKARNRRLNRLVALKVIRKERLDRPDVVQRFRREIRAAAQLNHPNVVLALDADEVNGTHFFAMEYVDGTGLFNYVKKNGPLPVEQACDFIRQAALGLQHAHERGLVHRDIKPGNLMVTTKSGPDGSRFGVIKVLDMGLARLDQVGDDDSTCNLTRLGAVVGTPNFSSPEQMLNPRTVDIRADLYSLGCTFYFLLTGQVPFPGGTFGEKLLKHQMQHPIPVEQLRLDVPPNVAAVVRTLMAKSPDQRYQTPAELAGVLTSILTPTARIAGADGQPPSTPGALFLGADQAALTARVVKPASSPVLFAAVKEPDERLDGASSVNDSRRQCAAAPPTDRRRLCARIGIGGGVGLVLAVLIVVIIIAASPRGPKAQTPAHGLSAGAQYAKKATRAETILATLRASGLPSLQEGKWYAIGPFDNTNKKGFDAVYPPEHGVDLSGSYPGKGNLTVQWKEVPDFSPGTVYNLMPLGGPYTTWAVVYLYYEIDVAGPTALDLSLGSDDTLTVWLNGKRLLSNSIHRGTAPDQEQVTLVLRKGKNQLLAKVCQGSGRWAFYILPRWPEALERAFGARLQQDFPAPAATPGR